MRSAEDGIDGWRDRARSAALAAVGLLWCAHLAFPLQYLQHFRLTLLGQVVPVYYLFIVIPSLAAAGLAMAAHRGWTRWQAAWFLFPLICLPGILGSADRLWSLRQWSSWLVRGVLPGGVLLLCDPRRVARLVTRRVYPVIIAAAVLGLTELWLYYANENVWNNGLVAVNLSLPDKPSNFVYRPLHDWYAVPTSRKPGGTQGNRVPYAAILVAFLPLGIWLAGRDRGWTARAALVALASIVILAQARAAWVGAVAGLAAAYASGLIRSTRQATKVLAASGLILGFFLALPITRSFLVPRLHSFREDETSIHERLEVLRTARSISERPLWGVGYGQFPEVYRRFFPNGKEWNETPDNQYLRWAIENGLAGLAGLLLFAGALVAGAFRRTGLEAAGSSEDSDFARSILSGWAALATTFLFFDGFYWGACAMTFWCFLGILASLLSSRDPAPPARA